MPVVAHPGPSAPAPPGVRLEVPEGWSAVPGGDALLRVTGPGAGGEEVVVLVRHVVDGPGTPAAAVVGERAAAAGPAGVVEDPFVVDLGGREWHARNVSWEEDGVPVVEVHLATSLAGTDAVSAHVAAAGTVRGAGLDDDYGTLQSVLETLVVEEAGA